MCRLLLTAVAIATAAAPVFANDAQDCFQSREPQLRIRGCSEILQRDPKDAIAYHNRAVAHGITGDIDSAIADYTMAIEIAPSYARAYGNRGRAYASKGDHARAVADEVKARGLKANGAALPIVIMPKTPKVSKATKAPKTTASVTKATTVPPKSKALWNANSNADKNAPGSSWWSWVWPWGGAADQANGKKAEPRP